MRPVRLVMQAFGPYPDRQVIDFREAMEAGLFGIYGPTGSGKSTIFSAMTFALFGEAARAEQGAASLRSDHADSDTPTEVEFVFDIGERRYVILRRPEQMRPKRSLSRETRDIHEAFLFDATALAPHEITESRRGRIIAEKKVGHVSAAVAELLGYGPEQFRQIVLLPQGRFEAFLAAKTKDRLDILRELFDVSLYRQLVAKMKADAEEAERQVRAEREVCAGRLTAEGFESTDALAAGIAGADGVHAARTREEHRRRELAKSSQTALEGARETEGRFCAAEVAEISLRDIQALEPEMGARAERVRDAERARGLLDVEERMIDAARDIATAAEVESEKRAKTASAVDRAEKAAAAQAAEDARAGALDALRRDVEALRRHRETIEKSVTMKAVSDTAAESELVARQSFEAARGNVVTLSEDMRGQVETLATARERDLQRRQTEVVSRVVV